MQIWLCPLLGFLLGSIPFGVLIAKAKGIDIRAHGSGAHLTAGRCEGRCREYRHVYSHRERHRALGLLLVEE